MGSGTAFSHLQGVTADSADNVYVSDDGTNRVVKFTADGRFPNAWSSLENGPYSLDVYRSSGDAYVANLFSDAVQGFSDDGMPAVSWNTLPLPAGVAVNPSSGEVYVSITGADDAVQQFQPV